MGKDYYKVLGIAKNATNDEINKIYKKLVFEYNQAECKSPQANEKFKEVFEAYEVLSDYTKRRSFDQHVEYSKDDIMDRPFMSFMSREQGTSAFGPQSFTAGSPHLGKKSSKQDPPLEHDLYISLEEVLKGATKKMKITKRVLNADGKTFRKEEKVLSIPVKPGWKAGTKITFHNEGDQNPGCVPADIVFIIKDKPHPLFTREGVDVRYTAQISLRETICGCTIRVPTLTGEKLRIQLNEIVKPQLVRKVSDQGLPYSMEPSKRGDLLITFDVKYPDSLTEETKQVLWDCLP